MSDSDLDLRTEWLIQVERAARAAGHSDPGSIPASMSFVSWCERLAANGLKVDGHPWSLADRPSLRPLYEAIPTTIAQAHRRTLVLRKGSQLGATLWECLADLYMAIKFEPCVVGLYLPDQATAADKSQRRFLRIIRTIPDAYRRLTTRTEPDGRVINVGVGNIMTRIFGESAFLFLWTSSVSATESRPCDILSYDEVQNMTLTEIDRVNERLSASRIRFRLLLSTANVPDGDIDHWYKLGTMNAFHTECQHCLAETDLSSRWPDICQYRGGEWTYVCPQCDGAITDPQRGRFIAAKPNAPIESWHLSQIQSPTIDARELAETWHRSVTGDQRKQWYNRKLGIGYIDPEQIIVSMAHCLACVAEGLSIGLTWLSSASGTVMGVDQMGSFNVVIIKRRLQDNRQAVCHIEAIFNDNPFERVATLMDLYGVEVCCLETLPNANDARRFANRFRGRVFLAKYATGAGSDMLSWGDAPGNRSDRKTMEEDRERWSVTIQQYKAMQASLFRIKNKHCLFPDPALLEQDVIESGERKRINITRDWVFRDFLATALVVEQDEETRTPKPRVVKIGGKDPHSSFANLLCDAAWSRVHGNSQFIMPQGPGEYAPPKTDVAQRVERQMPGLPRHVVAMIDDLPESVCGRCLNASMDGRRCELRLLDISPAMPSCDLFEPMVRK